MHKRKISFDRILNGIKDLSLPVVDVIVAIGNDGIIPAGIIQKKLDVPIEIVLLNYRDKLNRPIRKTPKLLSNCPKIKNKRVLLVDLVSRTGMTLNKAKELLKGNRITTFVINGKADISLFDYPECIDWPWNVA